MKIHEDQLHTDERLVGRLLEAQFPQWAKLPIVRVSTSGTECAIYRLGDEMAVRLPYRPDDGDQARKLSQWLPILGPQLPLSIPEAIASGSATMEYPAAWSIVKWLAGNELALARLADPIQTARVLAGFVRALASIEPGGGPVPGTHNFWRGVALSQRDTMTRKRLREADGLIDSTAAAAAWERDLHAPAWAGPPRWLHGDLAPDNLLQSGGELTAVIDWGGLAIGDPAADCLPAWNLFRGQSRDAYRVALGCDDATWARGRGLALSIAIVALPYYVETIPSRAERAREVINEVLDDLERHR